MAGLVNIERKEQLLRQQPCFAQLTNREVEELAKLLVEKHFYRGETIVQEGDKVDYVYLIESGEADVRHVSIIDHQAAITSIAKLHTEDAIGLNEVGFYALQGVRTATVVALADMVVLALSVAAFHGFALLHPHVNRVMRTYAAQIMGPMKM